MIKIFLDGSKMNAVDDKNNLVGFDTSDDCCAHGGWFVSVEKLDQELGEGKHDFTGNVNFPDYEFDTTYFDGTKRKDDEDADDGLSLGDDEGSLVRFKMVAPGKPDLYLHLYNCHNGYYSKGFEASFGEIKYEGYL